MSKARDDDLLSGNPTLDLTKTALHKSFQDFQSKVGYRTSHHAVHLAPFSLGLTANWSPSSYIRSEISPLGHAKWILRRADTCLTATGSSEVMSFAARTRVKSYNFIVGFDSMLRYWMAIDGTFGGVSLHSGGAWEVRIRPVPALILSHRHQSSVIEYGAELSTLVRSVNVRASVLYPDLTSTCLLTFGRTEWKSVFGVKVRSSELTFRVGLHHAHLDLSLLFTKSLNRDEKKIGLICEIF